MFRHLKKTAEKPKKCVSAIPAIPAVSASFFMKSIEALTSIDCAETAETAEIADFEAVLNNLPDILKNVIAFGDTRQEKKLLLISSIVTLSVCFPTVYAIYNGRRVYSNLFLFVVGPAASGKGKMNLCKNLVYQIHQSIIDSRSANKNNMLIVPANSSATAFYQTLGDNPNGCLMMETEGDTLADILAQDYGNYSSGFRAAFHHEPISYSRRAEHEYVEIAHPKLSVILTGTIGQLLRLMPSAENGLFSRFAFYNVSPVDRFNVSFVENGAVDLDDEFKKIGERVKHLYDLLIGFGEIEVKLSSAQAEKFNTSMDGMLQSCVNEDYADGIRSSILRLGLIRYRIGMVLTVLRLAEKECLVETDHKMYMSDTDFNIASSITDFLKGQLMAVLRMMPKPRPNGYNFKNVLEQQLFEGLDDEFSTDEWKTKAEELNINLDTAERYVHQWKYNNLTTLVKKGLYRKKY